MLIWFGWWVDVRRRRKKQTDLRHHIGKEAFDRSIGSPADEEAWLHGGGSRGSFTVADTRRVHTGGFVAGAGGDEHVLVDTAGNHHPVRDTLVRKARSLQDHSKV
jgi:hypothetical protein